MNGSRQHRRAFTLLEVLLVLAILGVLAAMVVVCPITAFAAQPPSITPEDVASASNAFACDLFAHLRSTPGNLFFTPLSISTALAMTYAGARQETAREMISVLHIPGQQHGFLEACASMLQRSQADTEDPPYQLEIANRLWGQEGEPFLDPFLNLVNDNYGGGFESVDFRGAREETRLAINGWIE